MNRGKRSVMLLCILLCVSIPVTALAITRHDMGSSAISIGTDVKEIELYMSEGASASQYTVTVQDGANAKIHLRNLTLKSKGSPIKILGEAAVQFVVHELNILDAQFGRAGIMFSNGSLVFSGQGTLYVLSQDGFEAAIGSRNTAMAGKIRVEDQVTMSLTSSYGSALGSANGHDMTGEIHVTGSAKLEAHTRRGGAALGSGKNGAMTGKILIDGQAKVHAVGEGGPAIGSGTNTSMPGTLQIQGQAQVDAYSRNPAVIGSDASPGMTGTIAVLDEAKIQVAQVDDLYLRNPRLGIIGSGKDGFTTTVNEGKYHLSDAASINGVSTGDVEALLKEKLVTIHVKEGKAQNVEIVPFVKPAKAPEAPKSPEALKPATPQTYALSSYRSLSALSGKVSVGPVSGNVKALQEERGQAIGSHGKAVLYAGKLSLQGQHDHAALLLHFHLGKAYANQTVTVLHEDQGHRMQYELVCNAQGMASVTVTSLGNFTVTLR